MPGLKASALSRYLGEFITWKDLRDAGIFVLVCAAAALLVNGVRPDGIPLIPKHRYEIFVPCPEPVGKAQVMTPQEFRRAKGQILVIDARSRPEYENWHHPEALNIPFSYLYPVEQEALKKIAAAGARQVIVYGDGGDPDPGEELARELSGGGIKNVFFVEGGAPALKE